MKRYFVLLLALMLVLALSGCGECEHQWTVADCINGSVCDKCGEAGEPALGHDWAAATCDTPETCTRCGTTQGEALAHAFGDWVLGDTEMTRTCKHCDREETAQPDRELYLHQLLKGRWEYYGTNMSGRWIGPYQSPWFTYAEYDGAGSLRYVTGQIAQDMPLVYTGYDPAQNTYHGHFVTGSGAQSPFVLEVRELGNLLTTNAGGEMEVVYCQYTQNRSTLLGTWTATANDTLYSLTLNPDGTFAGALGREVSGFWLMLPSDDDGGYGEGGCMLYYEQGGKWRNLIGEVSIFGTTPGMPDIPDKMLMHMRPDSVIGDLSFRQMEEEEVDALEAALAEAPTKILGQWKSKTYQEWDGSQYNRGIVLDYVLTVREDGTFTLSMDQEVHGTWSGNGVNVGDNYISYIYTINYPGATGIETASFNTRYDHLTFLYRNERGYAHYITFANLSEEKTAALLQGPELLPGAYVSEKVVRFDRDTQTYVETPETGYTITISADGIYTAILDEPVTGQWSFSDLHPDGGHNYIFQIKGSEYQTQRLEDGTLAFQYRVNGKYFTIHFRVE